MKAGMRWIVLMTCVVGTGCSAGMDAEPSETSEAIETESEALMRGGGLGAQQCPGGGSPQCVACDGGDCVTSCTGGYTCDVEDFDVEGGTATLCAPTGNCSTLAFRRGAFALGSAQQASLAGLE